MTSARTESLTPRTSTADRVVRSVCPYCAVGCGQRVFVKDEKVVQIAKAAAALESAFTAARRPSPTDAEKTAALRRGALQLTRMPGVAPESGASR